MGNGARLLRGLRWGIVAPLLAILLAMAMALPSRAQAVILTPELVESFIASFPEVQAFAESVDNQSSGGDDPTAGLAALMAAQGTLGRLNGIVSAHGFSSYSEWVGVMSSVATAWIFASEGGGMDAQMEEAAASIRANANLSAAQKEAMLAQMQAAAASMSANKPPQQNLDAVNAHADELREIFQPS